jgi:outer membrane protein assembly factor BamB
MNFLRTFSLALASGLAALSQQTTFAADAWPTFRGVNRSAVASEKGLLDSWPEKGPPLVWKSQGAGRGYAALAIADGRIYTLGDAPSTVSDESEYLLCFDQRDGRPLWQTKLGAPWAEGKPDWQSSRSTPTIDGDRVYVLTAHGDLFCCQTADGKQVWHKNLKTDFGGKKADSWGYSESVTVDGDNLLCTPGGEEHTMIALNKKTGALVWSTSLAEVRGAGHSSIVKSEIKGTRVLVQNTGSGPIGVRARDGKLLWHYPVEKTTAVIPTPIVRDDLVFFAVGYKRGAALLKQVPGEGGDVTIKEIYPLIVKLANKHGGVVLVGDYVYGDSDDAGIPFCAELMTGDIKWTKRGSGRGSACVAAADGHLYFHFANGKMILVEANPEEYSETGSFMVPGSGDRPSWSHPVILDGKLYLREQDTILCYNLRKSSSAQVSR